jgi:hypothetical protein
MQSNPYEDDMPLVWIPQQNRLNEARYAPARPSHQPASLQYQEWQQRVQDQKPKSQERMPKARALDLATPGSNHPLDPVFPEYILPADMSREDGT